MGFWLRRSGPEDAFRQRFQTVGIVAYGIDGGNPIFKKLVLAWNSVGFTPVLTVTHAPSVYVGGGTRYTARVVSQELGEPVQGVPISFTQTQGGGSLYHPPPGETDANGEDQAHYTASDDPGDVGETITVRAGV